MKKLLTILVLVFCFTQSSQAFGLKDFGRSIKKAAKSVGSVIVDAGDVITTGIQDGSTAIVEVVEAGVSTTVKYVVKPAYNFIEPALPILGDVLTCGAGSDMGKLITSPASLQPSCWVATGVASGVKYVRKQVGDAWHWVADETEKLATQAQEALQDGWNRIDEIAEKWENFKNELDSGLLADTLAVEMIGKSIEWIGQCHSDTFSYPVSPTLEFWTDPSEIDQRIIDFAKYDPSKFTVTVTDIDPMLPWDGYDDDTSSTNYHVAYEVEYNNDPRYKAKLYIMPGVGSITDAEFFDNAVVFADGFSPFTIDELYSGDWGTMFSPNYGIRQAGPSKDILFIDFDAWGGDIFINASMMLKIMEWIETQTGSNTYITAGFSMGGLVARTALLYSEAKNNVDAVNKISKTKGLITIDSPNQGANLNIDYQKYLLFHFHGTGVRLAQCVIPYEFSKPDSSNYLLQYDLFDTNHFAEDDNPLVPIEEKSFVAQAYHYYAFLNQPGTWQMLYAHAQWDSSTSRFVNSTHGHNVFYGQLEEMGNYRSDIPVVHISNGTFSRPFNNTYAYDSVTLAKIEFMRGESRFKKAVTNLITPVEFSLTANHSTKYYSQDLQAGTFLSEFFMKPDSTPYSKYLNLYAHGDSSEPFTGTFIPIKSALDLKTSQVYTSGDNINPILVDAFSVSDTALFDTGTGRKHHSNFDFNNIFSAINFLESKENDTTFIIASKVHTPWVHYPNMEAIENTSPLDLSEVQFNFRYADMILYDFSLNHPSYPNGRIDLQTDIDFIHSFDGRKAVFLIRNVSISQLNGFYYLLIDDMGTSNKNDDQFTWQKQDGSFKIVWRRKAPVGTPPQVIGSDCDISGGYLAQYASWDGLRFGKFTNLFADVDGINLNLSQVRWNYEKQPYIGLLDWSLNGIFFVDGREDYSGPGVNNPLNTTISGSAIEVLNGNYEIRENNDPDDPEIVWVRKDDCFAIKWTLDSPDTGGSHSYAYGVKTTSDTKTIETIIPQGDWVDVQYQILYNNGGQSPVFSHRMGKNGDTYFQEMYEPELRLFEPGMSTKMRFTYRLLSGVQETSGWVVITQDQETPVVDWRTLPVEFEEGGAHEAYLYIRLPNTIVLSSNTVRWRFQPSSIGYQNTTFIDMGVDPQNANQHIWKATLTDIDSSHDFYYTNPGDRTEFDVRLTIWHNSIMHVIPFGSHPYNPSQWLQFEYSSATANQYSMFQENAPDENFWEENWSGFPMAQFGVWGNLIPTDDYADFVEGSKSVRVHSNGMGGFFMYLYNAGYSPDRQYKDLSDMNTLKFHYKGTYNFKIKLETNIHQVYELDLANYASLSGNWEEVTIPLSHFTGLDFGHIEVLFGAHYVEAGVADARFDNIYFTE